MIEPRLFSYTVIIVTEKGKQYDISNFVQGLGWEELDRQLAARITFTVKNDTTSKGKVSCLAKPGCYVGLLYSYNDGKKKEAVRGKIVEWNPCTKLTGEFFTVKAYDELFDLQESEDNVYFSSGIGTKSAINEIFSKWKIPVGTYTGPDIKHGKLKFNNEKLGSIIIKILDEAKKKGGSKATLRAVKGKVQILAFGSNAKIYHFEEKGHLMSVSHKLSTAGMITRVKIVGEEKKDGRRPVEATVDGQVQYGIRQKIYSRGSDETLSEAQKAAKNIIDEEGKPEEEIIINAPDVPVIRKGDMIHLKSATVPTGYYHVVSVVHNCDDMEMEMTLEKTQKKSSDKSDENKKGSSRNIGDIVNFRGGKHYVSSDAKTGYSVSAGKAKITHKNPGSAHPWCLVTENWSVTHVWGWVDDGTFD